MSEEESILRSDEELWGDLLIFEGEAKADVMSCLAIGYSATEHSPFAIALAEEAKLLFLANGFDGSEIEFCWVYGVIAESKAYLELFDDAIEAGLKCYELCTAHSYPGYDSIRWDLIKWYLEAYRFEEARKHFESLHDRFKEVSEIDFSDFSW